VSPIIETIKSRGHWFVNMRPEMYSDSFIPDLAKCKSLIYENKVSLRGWDYPHWDTNKEVNSMINYVEQETEWQNHLEIWRLYQSGQFAHFLALREDWVDRRTLFPSSSNAAPGAHISITGTLYQLTEIYEFAARLASKGIFGSAFSLNVSLNKSNGRKLIFAEADRMTHRDYISKSDQLHLNKYLTASEISSDSPRLAREHLAWLFHRFNWDTAKPEYFIEDQKRLLEHRL